MTLPPLAVRRVLLAPLMIAVTVLALGTVPVWRVFESIVILVMFLMWIASDSG